MKKIAAILLSACLLLALAPLALPGRALAADPAAVPPPTPTAGDVWDGTASQPTALVQRDGVYYYEISTCAQLAFVAQTGGDWLTYNYILTDNLILNDVTLTWSEDGECTNTETLKRWTSIGYVNGYSFTGVFDGAGYTMSGWVNSPFRGNTGTIRNLTVVNSYVSSSCVSSGSTTDSVGGIAGYSSGTVEHCVFSGCVKSDAPKFDSSSGSGAGGILGVLSGNGSLSGCTVYGRVAAVALGGGVAGYQESDLSDCVNYARVTATGQAGGVSGYVSGINAKISGCSNYGAVTGGGLGGGIVTSTGSWSGVVISQCENHAPVSITSTTGYVGGIVGYQNAAVSDCTNSGSVTGGGDTGGISGYLYLGSVTRCGNTGAVTGQGYAGGVSGRSGQRGGISQCFNTGAVSGTVSAGGISGGRKTSGDAYLIENCYSTGGVSGAGYVGGILGSGSYYSMKNCYAIGPVSGGTDTGCLAGASNYVWGYCTLSNNFYRPTQGVSGVGGLADETGMFRAAADEELKNRDTFFSSGWNFGVWAIDESKNGGYPYLSWQSAQSVAEISPTGLTLSEAALSLGVGDVRYLSAVVSPANATGYTVTWSSSDLEVAAVSPYGRVEAVGPGEAVITARVGETVLDSCAVTVAGRAAGEYDLGALAALTAEGEPCAGVPAGPFWVSVPVKRLSAAGDACILLAAYDGGGRFVQMLCAKVEGLPQGGTVTLSFYLDNTEGDIAQVRAFCVSSLLDLTPVGGGAVSLG